MWLGVWFATMYILVYKISAQDPVVNLPQGRIVGVSLSHVLKFILI